jgi:linoleoyl-CoA desaturase
MEIGSVKYARKVNEDFSKAIKKRVRGYFKENNISKNANANMIIKTITMLSMYAVPLTLMMTGVVSSSWGALACYVTMGFGIAGIGMNVMHDAIHGAYSKNKKINTIMGYTISLCGGFPINWYYQHNVLHHTYTNIEGLDEDIEPSPVLRFSPFKKLMNHHRLQHLFAWFFYGMMTLLWTTTKDFKSMAKYKKMGLLKGQERSYASFMVEMVLLKLVYYVIVLFLPMYFLPIPWFQTLLMYLFMHFISGVTLGMVFQPAHVVPSTDYYDTKTAKDMKTNFEVSQMMTTSDFAPKSKIFSWFVGGLNFQVEHHLFPGVCHVHYPKLAKIVKETAAEFNVPYYCEKTFLSALLAHAKMLKDLGAQNSPALADHHH